MNVFPFSPIGNKTDVSASTAQVRTTMNPPTIPGVPLVLRVVNEATANALVAIGDSSVDATTDVQAMSVPTGERVFAWENGATHVSVALRTGTGTVQICLGTGV